MAEKKINRRDFLKISGIAAAALPAATTIAKIGNYEYVESQEKYGGFLIKRLAEDKPPYEIDYEKFERFSEYNMMFGRITWDRSYQEIVGPIGDMFSNGMKHMMEGRVGFNFFEHNLAGASWWLNENEGSGWKSWNIEPFPKSPLFDEFSPDEVTNYVKKAALMYGASEVGITEVKEEWFYKDVGVSPDTAKPLVFKDVPAPINDPEAPEVVIPKSMNRIIVMLIEQDYDHLLTGGVSDVSLFSTTHAYSRMAFTAGTLAHYIRMMGFQAIAMGNDTSLSIPIAIDAGLGEDSRMGVLVTPKYGPNVRIVKVLTDMPLQTDSPISFGVEEFCKVCGKCAETCPSSCILGPDQSDGPSYKTNDINNTVGVKKWTVDQKQCFTFWNENGNGCNRCIASCPFTKPQGWLHDATRIMIGAKSGALDSILVKMDEVSGYGGFTGTEDDPDAIDFLWNEKENYIHRKA